MWTVAEIRDFFEIKRGVRLQALVKGPSDSTLLFYPWGRHHLIVQVWPNQGFDVHCNNLSPKVGDTIEWLDSLLGQKKEPAPKPELPPHRQYAYIFEGDGRQMVEPQPDWEMPGMPIPLRRGLARQLGERFDEMGVSNHSENANTLWVAIAWAQYKEFGSVLTHDGYGGYTLRKLA